MESLLEMRRARQNSENRSRNAEIATRHAPALIHRILFFVVLFVCVAPRVFAADTNEAKMSISGYGLFGDLDLKRMLKSLDVRGKKRAFYDANDVEDAALILFSRVKQDGYLKPEIDATLTFVDGGTQTFQWRETVEPPLPRPSRTTKVVFKIREGVLYHYHDIKFEGLHAVKEKEARAFFVERGLLLPLKSSKVFTPQKFHRGTGSLLEVLERRGYDNAEITRTNIVLDDRTGQANVTIGVSEGLKSVLQSIRVETYVSTNSLPESVVTIQTNVTFSKLWLQDFTQQLRATNLHRGFPDTTVEIVRTNEATGTNVTFDLITKVRSGEKVMLGTVTFEGQEKTKLPLLKRRVRLKPGEPLDRIAAEQGRYRLTKLGIFDSVGMRYDVVDEHHRNVHYVLREGKWVDVNLLFGFGSYELLRAGVEVEQYNVFGRAHRARLRLVQSFKASTADFLYTMPEFVGEDVDFFLQGTFLRRDEISFTRQEFGGGAGAKTIFANIQSELVARYNFEILNATDIVVNEGPSEASVSAVVFDLKHDLRDSPLNPRNGYKIYSGIELASQYLGGDVNYARFRFDASYHHPIIEGNWIHLNLDHGTVGTLHGSQRDLPFNKRFFPGGDNSVRGFQYGEAAPRNAVGETVGAETYTVGNAEFEQALTPKLSLVVFADAIGFAHSVQNFPGDELLLSVGGGLSWQTIIGPVRLEYGYNAIKRTLDPVGTLQFSIGFPF
ncbi:MAG: surface antigen [Verrucomicrobiales bacterium]|nr:surface antigen [Verrucomicrobiales bacterium]